ncbi:hypothetical protein [Bradyrhizobium sp. Gha]|uniref:hypothetical protein n=1 Tax=Bradyrhizobium sp. Gha TaxID=1855318 RepID=UPI0011605E7A|nr:hypothetical protein [Bradyrhizobium sp. Gha]
MAKVSIRKDDYERVLEIAERAAKRTNSRVVVATDRLDLHEPAERDRFTRDDEGVAVKFS